MVAVENIDRVVTTVCTGDWSITSLDHHSEHAELLSKSSDDVRL